MLVNFKSCPVKLQKNGINQTVANASDNNKAVNSLNILGAMDKMSIGQKAQVSFGSKSTKKQTNPLFNFVHNIFGSKKTEEDTNPLLEIALIDPIYGSYYDNVVLYNKALGIAMDNPDLFFVKFQDLGNDEYRRNVLLQSEGFLYSNKTIAEKFAADAPELLLNCLEQIKDGDIRTEVLKYIYDLWYIGKIKISAEMERYLIKFPELEWHPTKPSELTVPHPTKPSEPTVPTVPSEYMLDELSEGPVEEISYEPAEPESLPEEPTPPLS